MRTRTALVGSSGSSSHLPVLDPGGFALLWPERSVSLSERLISAFRDGGAVRELVRVFRQRGA